MQQKHVSRIPTKQVAHGPARIKTTPKNTVVYQFYLVMNCNFYTFIITDLFQKEFKYF